MEEVGWSLVVGGVGSVEVGMEGELVIVEVNYYMEFLRELLGEVKFYSRLVGVGVGVGVRCGGGEDFWSEGGDAVLAMMELLDQVSSWWWVERCPSLGVLSLGGVLGEISGGGCIEFELEGDKIKFLDGGLARALMGRWERWVIKFVDQGVGGEHFYGVVRLMEGDFEIWGLEEGGPLALGGGMAWGVGNYSGGLVDIWGFGGRPS
jgi:hypothetical protein